MVRLHPRGRARPAPGGAWRRVLLLAPFLAAATGEATAQEAADDAAPAAVTGRILDAESNRPVADATVTVVGTGLQAVTDREGLFRFESVPGGTWTLQVRHLAYGEHSRPLEVDGGAVLAVRVSISRTAIALDPVVVEARTEREQALRARGASVHEVTREEIREAARTSYHVGDVLRQQVPGMRVRDTNFLPGANVCVEFRNPPTTRFAGTCRHPMVFLDGVRMFDPPTLLSTLNLDAIERMEVIPPSEAGVLYGTDAAFGVLLIETTVWREEEERNRVVPRELRGYGTYDWALEAEPHPWKRVLGWTVLGNAAGLALGLLAADECIAFEELAYDLFTSECDGWGTWGSRLAAVTLPLAGAAVAARYSGTTDLSQGRLLPTVLAGAVVLVPGYALASTSFVDDFSATRWAGQALLLVGVPAAVTVADHLFRRIRGAEGSR